MGWFIECFLLVARVTVRITLHAVRKFAIKMKINKQTKGIYDYNLPALCKIAIGDFRSPTNNHEYSKDHPEDSELNVMVKSN